MTGHWACPRGHKDRLEFVLLPRQRAESLSHSPSHNIQTSSQGQRRLSNTSYWTLDKVGGATNRHNPCIRRQPPRCQLREIPCWTKPFRCRWVANWVCRQYTLRSRARTSFGKKMDDKCHLHRKSYQGGSPQYMQPSLSCKCSDRPCWYVVNYVWYFVRYFGNLIRCFILSFCVCFFVESPISSIPISIGCVF